MHSLSVSRSGRARRVVLVSGGTNLPLQRGGEKPAFLGAANLDSTARA